MTANSPRESGISKSIAKVTPEKASNSRYDRPQQVYQARQQLVHQQQQEPQQQQGLQKRRKHL
jgi:hypothetical protein